MALPPESHHQTKKRPPRLNHNKPTPVPGQTGNGSGPSPAKNPTPRSTKQAVDDNKHQPGPPNFPRKIPVRPGAITNRDPRVTEPTTQAQRTHVHKARANASRDVDMEDIPKLLAGGITGDDIANAHIAELRDYYNHEKASEKHGDSSWMGALLSGKTTQGAVAAIGGVAEKAAPVAAGMLFRNVVGAAKGIDAVTGSNIAGTAGEVIGNAGREAVDIPLNTVPAAYHFYDTWHKKGILAAGGLLAEPYKEAIKDPVGFAKENPISTLLMFQPVVRAPIRAVGRPTRVQQLGTTGVESTRRGSGLRGRQTKTEPMKASEMDYRVDVNIHEAWNRQVNPWWNAVEEFSHKGTGPNQRPVVKPTFEKAQDLARDLSKKKGQAGTGNTHGPWEVIRAGYDEDSGYVVIPKKVHERLNEHATKFEGTPPEFTQFAKLFRQGVLLSSPKWMPGNVSEALLRSMVSRSGLVDYAAGKRIQGGLARTGKENAGIFDARTTAGGHWHLAGQNIEDIGTGKLKMVSDKKVKRGGRAGEYAADIFKGMGRAARNPHHPREVGRGIAQSYNGFSKFVFESVNGGIEHQFQTTHMAQAMRRNKLIPRGMAFRNKAFIDEWAKGLTANKSKLRNLATDVGRDIDRSYGRYGKMSPRERWYIGHFTPFFRWSANAIQFLYHVMPADHPVMTAAVASMSKATEDYRKTVGQYYEKKQLLDMGAGKPTYLQGSVPGKNGSVLRLSHYTPMGIHEQGAAGLADLVIPFGSTILQNMSGNDWKGDKLAHDGIAMNIFASIISGIEQSVPFAKDGADLLGIRRPNMAKGQRIPSSAKERGKKLAPFTYTKVHEPKKKTGNQLDLGGSSGGHEWDFSTGGGGEQWDFGG